MYSTIKKSALTSKALKLPKIWLLFEMKNFKFDFWISGKILSEILVRQHTLEPPIYEVKINVLF